MRPMAWRDAETALPMHVEAASSFELAFEVGLHLEQFQAEHLRVGDERIGSAVPDVDRLVDEIVGLGPCSASRMVLAYDWRSSLLSSIEDVSTDSTNRRP